MSQRWAAPKLTPPLGGRRRAFAADLGRSQGKTVACCYRRRGFCPSCGAGTLIQRLGSAVNLNIQLHCLVLDGA